MTGESMSDNPYQSPTSAVAERERRTAPLDDVVSGQKFVVWAILLYFVAVLARAVIGPLALVLLLGCIGLSWFGIYRMGRGLGYALWVRVILVLLMLIPLVGLLVLLALNSKATSRIKAAGYRVGLLGASDY